VTGPRWFFAGLLVAFAAGQLIDRRPGRPVKQPVEYNHALHIEKDMVCKDCHQGVERQAAATIPGRKVCLDCHEAAIGSGAREAALVSLLKNPDEIAWKRLTLLPRHIYFSHRRHVAIAKIECPVCHGQMAKQDHPPDAPLIKTLSMDDCLRCHRARKASTDCNACHR